MVQSSLRDLPSRPSVASAFGILLSIEMIPPTETRVSNPHVSPAQSDVLGCSEVSFWKDSVLSRDELSAEDLASQQSATAPVAIDFSLFLKSWQEEVLASVNILLATQLGGLSNSVPSTVANPSSSSSALVL